MVGRSLPHRARKAGTYAASPVGRLGRRTADRFVIYCPPRTGSDLLVSLLDAHPAIRCEGEIIRIPPRHPVAWFDGRAAISRVRGQSVWGCKVITHDLCWHPDRYDSGRAFLQRLDALGYQIICIRRRNLLLQALSLVHATSTKYHFTIEDNHRFEAMRVDPVHLLYCLYALELEDNEAAASVEGLPALQLWYEDDLLTSDRQQATLGRLTDLFGLHRITARSRVVPGAPPTLAERVANLDEVSSLVAATRFERFLHMSAGASLGYPEV